MALGRFTQTVQVFPSAFSDAFPLASSTVLRADGGRFVVSSSGNYALATSAATQLDGWLDSPIFSVTHDGTQGTTPFTSSSTAGADLARGTRDIHEERFAVWMPANSGATLSDSLKDTLCDLAIEGSNSTTKQVVATTTTTNKVVKILGVDAVNGMVLVSAVK